jgi:hypothetical protein
MSFYMPLAPPGSGPATSTSRIASNRGPGSGSRPRAGSAAHCGPPPRPALPSGPPGPRAGGTAGSGRFAPPGAIAFGRQLGGVILVRARSPRGPRWYLGWQRDFGTTPERSPHGIYIRPRPLGLELCPS